MKPVIITHLDLDGVASAAVYCRLTGCIPREARVVFTEPDSLPAVLDEASRWIEGEDIAICDLGPNTGTFDDIYAAASRIVERGSRIRWFDHHVWEDEWISMFKDLGVELHLDRSTCAAGVVAKGLGVDPDEVTAELVRAACAADIWRWDHPLAPRLFRVTGRYRGRRGDKWNRHILELMVRGVLWNDELQEVLEEYVDLELNGYARGLAKTRIIEVDGCRVAVLAGFRGPPGNSLLAAYILSRTGADLAAITRRYGSVSLRSRRVDVRSIAMKLGGGGHPVAAGARLQPPIYVRIAGLLFPPAKRMWFERLLRWAVREARCRELS